MVLEQAIPADGLAARLAEELNFLSLPGARPAALVEVEHRFEVG